jgi:hypothetical protein
VPRRRSFRPLRLALATIGNRTADALPSLRGVNHMPARIGSAIPVNDTTSVPNMSSTLLRSWPAIRSATAGWLLQTYLLAYYSIAARKNFHEARNSAARRAARSEESLLTIPDVEIVL